MFKIKNTHKITYSEVGQPNPLRWRIMLRRKDTLHSQSGLIKCKDFFNDVEIHDSGKEFVRDRFDEFITVTSELFIIIFKCKIESSNNCIQFFISESDCVHDVSGKNRSESNPIQTTLTKDLN